MAEGLAQGKLDDWVKEKPLTFANLYSLDVNLREISSKTQSQSHKLMIRCSISHNHGATME